MRHAFRLFVPAVACVAALLLAALARTTVLDLPDDHTGFLLVAQHVADLVVVLAVLAIAVALGWQVLGRFGVGAETPVEAVLFGSAMGLGVLALAVLVLGAVGLLNTTALAAVLVAGGLAAWRQLHELASLAARAVRYRLPPGAGALPLVAILVSGVMLLFLLLQAIAPPADWDALMYHLEIPRQFLEQGRILLPPDNLHVAFVGLVHMIYVPLLALAGPAATALLSALLAALLAAAVAAATLRWFDRNTAALAAIILWGSSAMVLVAITPRVDVSLTYYLFLAHYALLRGLDEQARSGRWLALGALLLGFGVGVKFNALAYGAGLAPLLAWTVWRSAPSAGARLGRAVGVGAIALAAAAPWLLKNWLLLGAPLYPYFADRLLEPWLVPLFGTELVPSTVDPVVFRTMAAVRERFDLVAAFFTPERLTVELEGEFYSPSLALLAVPLWLVVARRRVTSWLAVPALLYLAAVIVPFGTTNLRYLIPAYPALTVVSAVALMELGRRMHHWKAGVSLAAVALLMIALVNTGRAARWRLSHPETVRYALGAASAHHVLETHFDPSVRSLYATAREANRQLGPDHRLLMLFEARGYWFDVPIYQDNRVANWPLLVETPAPADCLRAAGVTHVLIGAGAVNYYVARGLSVAALRWTTLNDFTSRCIERVYRQPGLIVGVVR